MSVVKLFKAAENDGIIVGGERPRTTKFLGVYSKWDVALEAAKQKARHPNFAEVHPFYAVLGVDGNYYEVWSKDALVLEDADLVYPTVWERLGEEDP